MISGGISLLIRLNSLNSNPFSANFTRWSNTIKQFVGNLPTNCLSAFDHFMELLFKVLKVKFRDDPLTKK